MPGQVRHSRRPHRKVYCRLKVFLKCLTSAVNLGIFFAVPATTAPQLTLLSAKPPKIVQPSPTAYNPGIASPLVLRTSNLEFTHMPFLPFVH